MNGKPEHGDSEFRSQKTPMSQNKVLRQCWVDGGVPRPRGQAEKSAAWLGIRIGAAIFVGLILLAALVKTPPSTGPSRPASGWTSPTRSVPEISSSQNRPQPPVETREHRVRQIVTMRLARSGIESDSASIDAAVQKVLGGHADPTPSTGVLTRNFIGHAVAPLEIKTQVSSNYFIKVVDWSTMREILTAFIRGGEDFETSIPTGSYEIKYAVGHHWFGPILDFGDGAVYSKCDQRFDFTRSSIGYDGYTIELILQQRGNLQTDEISADEF